MSLLMYFYFVYFMCLQLTFEKEKEVIIIIKFTAAEPVIAVLRKPASGKISESSIGVLFQ